METNPRELVFVLVLMIFIFVFAVGASIVFYRTWRKEMRDREQK
jgi:hypothetical protein